MSMKIWYNYWQPPYNNANDPNFFDPSQYDWAAKIMQNWAMINRELQALIAQRNGQLLPYFVGEMDNGTQSWQTLSFKTWGIAVNDHLAACPGIAQLLAEIPQLVSASVNLLAPNSQINPHQGDTNAILRCHLGIDIPSGLPLCGFAVNGEQRAWEVGKLLIFCDAHRHWAWNNSGQNRLIFLFDIVREPFREQQKGITLRVRAFLLLQWLRERLPILGKLPKYIHYILFSLIRLFLWLIYPIQQKYGVFLKHS